jgi:hypothetical protein
MQEKFRSWLSPPDPSVNHNTASKTHHSGTAKWFIQGSTFRDWKKNGSLLWVRGNRMPLTLFSFMSINSFSNFAAGAGKSILWCVVSHLLL